MHSSKRRELLVSKGWIQAVALVMLFGFFVLGLLAYRTYMAKPPTPERMVDPQGKVLYTAKDISEGQQVFLHNGLMEYGSVFGHGAYLGPDYTADYLRRSSDFVRRSYGGSASDSAARRTIEDFRTNRFDERTGTATLTAPQAAAHERLIGHYSRFFSEPTTRHGLRKEAITDPSDLRQLTAFFAWTAWAGSTERPGKNYTYTNNWPPEPRVDNKPTANVVVWSVLSLIALLGGIGLLFGAFGRWNFLGWHGREQVKLSFRAPGDVALTPAQRACAWFFFVMAALFLIQTFVGAASQHYRAEIGNFFGFDLAAIFPWASRGHGRRLRRGGRDDVPDQAGRACGRAGGRRRELDRRLGRGACHGRAVPARPAWPAAHRRSAPIPPQRAGRRARRQLGGRVPAAVVAAREGSGVVSGSTRRRARDRRCRTTAEGHRCGRCPGRTTSGPHAVPVARALAVLPTHVGNTADRRPVSQ